jgi:uncharacterized protein (DUF302 family)
MTGGVDGLDDREPLSRDASGTVTHASPVGIDQLLRRVLGCLEDRGLELFAVIDHSGQAAEVGLDMPATKLVIFGNPKGGTPLMLAHPLIALDLPLKLLLWETDEHDAFVSYNAPGYLAARYGLDARETEALGAVEAIARAVLSA